MDLVKELQEVKEKSESQSKGFFSDIDFTNDSSKTPVVTDKKEELVNSMFQSAVVAEVKQNQDLKDQVLQTAHHFVSTKMDTTKTQTETENSIAKVKKDEDAVSCYGMPSDKPISKWALAWMRFGYNIMLGLYILVASFTVMPIIFLVKKINVGIKQTKWAILLGILLYVLIGIVVPLTIGLTNK